MKFYTLNTKFTFGKFSGKTLEEVLKIQPGYIDWCLINLDHYCLSKHVIEQIKVLKPGFTISEKAEQILSDKYLTWGNEQLDSRVNDSIDYWEGVTYENYNGSYAQDTEGWSDQDIDDLLDGDPDAYWNID